MVVRILSKTSLLNQNKWLIIVSEKSKQWARRRFFGANGRCFKISTPFFVSFFVNKRVTYKKKIPGSLNNTFYISPVNLNEIGEVVPKKSRLPFSKCSFEINAFKVFSKFSLCRAPENTPMDKLTCTLQFWSDFVIVLLLCQSTQNSLKRWEIWFLVSVRMCVCVCVCVCACVCDF